jgi:hypothetical protein
MSRTSESRTAHLDGWNGVRIEVDRLITECPDPFDLNTIANMRDLLAICQNERPVPVGVSKGYWSTVSLCWGEFEIEVFEDRFEVYRFPDQRIDIWYEEHKPGEAFSPRFIAELAALSPGACGLTSETQT